MSRAVTVLHPEQGLASLLGQLRPSTRPSWLGAEPRLGQAPALRCARRHSGCGDLGAKGQAAPVAAPPGTAFARVELYSQATARSGQGVERFY